MNDMKNSKINPEKDAFGQEIWAYHRGDQDAEEVAEREDGYVCVNSGPESYLSEYNDWSLPEKKVMKFVKGPVLDIGCGAGRHYLHLQKSGFDVTGIDNSPLAIKVCKLRGMKKASVLSIDEIEKFGSGSFNTVLLMCNNFGLLQSLRKARLILKKIHWITTLDALIIAETTNPYKNANSNSRKYHELNKSRGRMPGQLRMRIRFEHYKSDWFDYLTVSKKEMKEILKGTGWKVKQFIDYEKSPHYIAIIGKG
jgi:SAM-dependent methyltransferase